MVASALPGHVAGIVGQDIPLFRLELGFTDFAYTETVADEAAKAVLAALQQGPRFSSQTDPDGTVWVVANGELEPELLVHSTLDWALNRRLDQEMARRRQLEENAFSAIGWRELRLPTPEGPPDDRIKVVGHSTSADGSIDQHGLTGTDLVDDMRSSARTLVVVPDAVEELIQMTRLLYVRGWHEWEFFTLGSREAYLALEASLRLLDAEERGKLDNGAGFKTLLDRVGSRSGQRPVLSEWERGLADSMRKSRNALTHPALGQTVQWISWAHLSIEGAIRLVNLMWGRRAATVPPEIGWEAPVPIAGG